MAKSKVAIKFKKPKIGKLDYSLMGKVFLFSLITGVVLGLIFKGVKIIQVKAYKMEKEREQSKRLESLASKIEKGFYYKNRN